MNVQRVAAIGSIAAVAVAVVAGLIVLGSPAEQRLLRLDERRVNDLRQLSWAAEYRWNQDRGLANAAVDLVNSQSLSRLPQDPVTNQPYEYRVTGTRAYELCGVFDRASPAELAGDFWFHEAGRACFAFELPERATR